MDPFAVVCVDSPYENPVVQKFYGFFVVSLDKILNKQSRGQWNQMP